MDITLKTKAEKKAQKACDLDAFASINLLLIKKSIADMLSLIGRNEIFDQYTKHDISHVDMMLASLDYIIPKETAEKLTGADWLLIVLSIYFHDLGMLVTKKEYSERYKSKEFKDFQGDYLQDINNSESLKDLPNDERDHFIYQEYIRYHHGDRIAKWILQEESNYVYYDENVTSVVEELVKGMRPLFRNDLAILCESHLLDDIDNLDKYKVGQSYGVSPNERGNVLYAALILRTADLLHITSDRTPTIQYRVISPTNPKSQQEWCKQNAVSSVSPKIAEDPDGNKNENLPMDTLEVNAFFEKEDGFFSLIEYLKYVRSQLHENYRINEIAKKKYASKYEYPWKDIDDSTIQTKNFERRQLAFSIDQNKVLSLLVGETLYNNMSVTLRELSQNAIDAVKVKQYEIQTEKGNSGAYTPTIDVYWYEDSRELFVCDNGTGMNMDIIENHLLKVGSSRYQDPSFQKKHPGYNSISRFGIGLLTCFLIADDVDILTNMDEREKPLLLKIRNVHGKYLLKHGSEKGSNLKLPYGIGTSLKLKVRPDVVDFNPEKILKNWILIPGCQFTYHSKDNSINIGFKTPREMVEKVCYKFFHGLSDGGKKGLARCLTETTPVNLDSWHNLIDRVLSFGFSTSDEIAKVVLESYFQGRGPEAIVSFNAELLLPSLINAHAYLDYGQHLKFMDYVTEPITSRYLGRLQYIFCHGVVQVPYSSKRAQKLFNVYDKLVFSENEYLQLANSSFAWQSNSFFNILTTSTVIFIGLSFTDANLRRWLSWIHACKKEALLKMGIKEDSTSHYWIEKIPADRRMQRWYELSVAHLGIRIIWINDWYEVPEVLKKAVHLV